MQYRAFGKSGWKGSALGFGAMRLPTIGDDPAGIDEAEAMRMLRFAIDSGVNYVDTAYSYHSGNSELFLGRALRDGYREKIRLATKLPCWEVKATEDFDRLLDIQLDKLQTDHLDFYLLHGLAAPRWAEMKGLGVLPWAERALADGRIGHLGFSFHDKCEVLTEIVDATGLWTFCQIQYNYMDVEYQAGREGLRYAAERDLAVVIMEPLRGGMLAQEPPPSVQAVWDGSSVSGAFADRALQWLWSDPAVAVVLSGMSTMEQVEQNILSADRSAPGKLSAAELQVYERVREAYLALSPIPCTNCGYCMPCPSGVNIPRIFEIFNDLQMYGNKSRAQLVYDRFLRDHQRADNCVRCDECLEKCPQNINIPDWLETAHKVLSTKETA